MYCPNCGSSNKPGTKFCARCGTNVAVVTDALAGKATGTNPLDERMMKLIKDYHKGRRDAITGGILIPAGLLIMSIMVAAGLNPIGAFFIICWMFFWGAAALADGIGKWIGSSGEMKTLGFMPQPAALPQAKPTPPLAQLHEPGYSTGPIDYPGSVTEQTTRQLDERAYRPPAENQSETSD
ncbi:MAG TPA: zinc ribbon domain-containing protein [Blastocatellia bacterium]|nr:zinc ribbon domain-containing protein [Blastocatellia bacterium]